MPTFSYLLIACCTMDDVPLRLCYTRKEAEFHLIKQSKLHSSREQKGIPHKRYPSGFQFLKVIEFKDGIPYSELYEFDFVKGKEEE